MTAHLKPFIRAADLRQLVAEMVARGCVVEIRADGSIKVTPANIPPADPFDLVDMSR
jgi:hypothetical protein